VLDEPAQRRVIAHAGGGERGGQAAVERGVAAGVDELGQRTLVEPGAVAGVAGAHLELERMRAQPARHHADVAHDGVAVAVTGASAHEPDRAQRRAEPVAAPLVERDRVAAAEDDRADVLRMTGGVDRHQVGAVGLAPEVEPVDPERGPHRLEVVGDRVAAVVAGTRAERPAAAADRAGERLVRSGTIWVSAGPSGMAEEPGPPGLKRTVLSEPGRVTSAYATLVVPAPGSERSSGTVTLPQRAPAIPSQASADGAVASAATSTARASPSFIA
jgi:hypothetical protein